MSVLESSSTTRPIGGRQDARAGASASASSWSRSASIRARISLSTGTAARPASHSQKRSVSPRDQLLGRRQLGAPPLEVGRDDRLEIVEVVEEDVAELADRRIDVARQRDVEHAERAVAARRERRANVLGEDDRSRRRRRADEHVDVGEQRPRFVVVHRDRAVSRRRAPSRARTFGSRRSRRERPDPSNTRARAPPSRPHRAPWRAFRRAIQRSASPAAPPRSSPMRRRARPPFRFARGRRPTATSERGD